MSTPNQEQCPAIYHRGGVLLKAGAGSGKTFVLVEHAIHLTREWRLEWENDPQGSFGDYIAEKFSSAVLMTFTRLAAGEILVRLTLRFQHQVNQCEESEREWWQEALKQIDRLQVTTIDGFFYKLVRKGFFKHIPPDVEIIMDGPRRKRIISLFDQWWNSQASRLQADISRDIVMHRVGLVETLLEIFNDPTLREAWMNFTLIDARPTNLAWLANLLPELEGWQTFLALERVEVPENARQKNHKWVALADALNARSKVINNWSDILQWDDFIKTEVGQTRLNLGASKELVGYYFDEWRDFKGSVSKWADSFRKYETHFESRILPWLSALLDLVKSINSELRISEGITYGDLEFHVLQGIKDPAVAQKIQNEFTYFVVDEFQDTSRIQYEILKLVTGNRPERLFCIGDEKQAIYGFRGGELKVFSDVQSTPNIATHVLRSNYRSRKEVVHFNNTLFERLFPLGVGWEGVDAHAVAMEKQATLENQLPGSVEVLEAELPDVCLVDPAQKEKKSPKWRSSFLMKAESALIAQSIKTNLETQPNAVIAVLYKKLAPSRLLMQELMKLGIGFTAQAKIPFRDDPLAGILMALIEDYLGEKKTLWSRFLIGGYLHLLGLPVAERLKEAIERFIPDTKIFGTQAAFDLFLGRLGFANSFFEGMAEIRQVINIAHGDLEAILLQLKAMATESWSADFRFGLNPQRVVIQTSHGSKGLEYDIVFVAGLATNGRSKSTMDWAGALPGAALWVEDPANRTRLETPQLVFEKTLKKQKEFAESKRLFYVACTRAKHHLKFVRLIGQGEQLSLDKNSWAQGLEAYLSGGSENTQLTRISLSPEDLAVEAATRPFFHNNSLGLSKKLGADTVAHAITSELSVTALNALIDCPRKFYFKQILKLSEDSFEEESGDEWGGERELVSVSSSARGSAIHLGLSNAINQNFVLPREWVNHKDKGKMGWALARIQEHHSIGARFVSEQQLKFPIFGFMMSGIPDLVVYSGSPQIWDFKTGRRNETGEIKYWVQLKTYALALWNLGLIPLGTPIDLLLCYLDSVELPKVTVQFDQVKNELFEIWRKIESLDQINPSHCDFCPYKGICPR